MAQDNSYVQYQYPLRPVTLRGKLDLFELWGNLPPDLDWKDGEAWGGQMGRRGEAPGVYVWIPPDTVKTMKDRPEVLLVALVNRRGDVMEASYVEPIKGSVREVLQALNETNQEITRAALDAQTGGDNRKRQRAW